MALSDQTAVQRHDVHARARCKINVSITQILSDGNFQPAKSRRSRLLPPGGTIRAIDPLKTPETGTRECPGPVVRPATDFYDDSIIAFSIRWV